MQFDINYGAINLAQPARPAPRGPLYAAVDGRAASLSNSECIFQARDGGELHVMTHQVLQALDQCREFRTLDEHVARVTSVLPGLGGQAEAVRHVLGGLVERGVLRSDSQFLEALARADEVRPAALAAVAIRACDRPAQLGRLLDSLAAHGRRHGRSDAVWIIDDSTDAQALERHQALGREHARDAGVAVRHVGPAQAAALCERLGRELPQARETLRGLLLRDGAGAGFGGGRGYNLALLLSAGRRLSLLDDDYLLPFHRASVAQPGLEPMPGTGFEARFQDGMAASLATGPELEQDGFALQQDLVGSPLAAAMARHPELLGLDRERLRGQSLSRLSHLAGPARVLATFTGTRGASFTGDSLWLYRLAGASRDAFWASREGYLANVHAEALEFAPARAIARPHGLFTPFMLDNSALLPCTAVHGRGEDGLFGVVSGYLYPDALTLHLPITIGHVQEGRRDRHARAMAPLTPGINRFLREWIVNQAQPARSADPGERLALLAAQLEDLAGAPQAARVEMLEEYLRYVRADLIEHLQQQILDNPKAPVYWLADVRQIVEVNGRALLAGDPPRLDEWPAALDAAGCADRLSLACRDLAASWRHWPAIWRRAAELGGRLLED